MKLVSYLLSISKEPYIFLEFKTSQELRMLSSVALNCQATKIVIKSGSQLSELWSVSQMWQVSGIVYVIVFVIAFVFVFVIVIVFFWSGHVPSSLWSNVSKVTSL